MAPAACGPERNVGTFSATSVTQLNSQLNSGRRPDGPRCHEGYGRSTSSGLPLGPGETTSPSILPDGLRGRPHACRRGGVPRSVGIPPEGSGAILSDNATTTAATDGGTPTGVVSESTPEPAVPNTTRAPCVVRSRVGRGVKRVELS